MPKLSIFSWFGFPIPMEAGCKLIKKAGFDGVMLFWSADHLDSDVKLARQNGLCIENVHAPFEDSNALWEDTSAGDKLEQTLAKCIVDCSHYEIATAVVHVTGGDNPPPLNRVGLDRLQRLAAVAAKHQINIALENLRRPEYLDFIYTNIHSGRLGFCYDSGHENCYSQGTDLLAQYGSKLMALHLHDNDGSADQHLIPGEGSIDWSHLKQRLRGTGYQGAIALEVIKGFAGSSSDEPPELFLKRAFAAAQSLSPQRNY
jgi:L-ribulose-5-phosphate 3-epimerase